MLDSKSFWLWGPLGNRRLSLILKFIITSSHTDEVWCQVSAYLSVGTVIAYFWLRETSNERTVFDDIYDQLILTGSEPCRENCLFLTISRKSCSVYEVIVSFVSDTTCFQTTVRLSILSAWYSRDAA